MNRNRYVNFHHFVLIGGGAGVIFIALFFTVLSYVVKEQPHIAYVRSGDVLAKYEGLREVENKLSQDVIRWQKNLDTLQHEFEIELQRSKDIHGEVSTGDSIITAKQQQIEQYYNAITKKRAEEEEKILNVTIDRMNELIAQYAKVRGISILFGTGQGGHLLYGNETLDVTDEVIDYLNAEYRK